MYDNNEFFIFILICHVDFHDNKQIRKRNHLKILHFIVKTKVILERFFDDDVETINLFMYKMNVLKSYENLHFFTNDEHVYRKQSNTISDIVFVVQICIF